VLTIAARVSVSRPSVAGAVEEAASAATRLRQAVAGAGVAAADVSTTGYALEPEHDPDDHRRIIGYRAEHSVTVAVRDLDRAGEVLDAATTSSGDDVRVGGLVFDIADKSGLEETARRLAWEDARSRAGQLAGHAGVTLGPATDIDETVAAPVPLPRMAMAAMETHSPIAAGNQTVTVSVTVTFAIDD
jgi:uncharacterized protein YggE